MTELQADFEADAQAIDGRIETKPVILSQPASWQVYGASAPRSDVPLAMVKAASDTPAKFLLVGPKYQHPYVDGVHLTGNGARRMWQDFGRAIAGWYVYGAWTFMGKGASASRSGTTVTVTIPETDGGTPGGGWVSPMVIDTTLVTDPGNYGVSYVDGGGSPVTVSAVSLVGANQIQFTIASAVAGTVRFGTVGTPGADAGPSTGPRTCFRDSLSETYADGAAAYNWLACLELPVA